jgi:hypothetical protein
MWSLQYVYVFDLDGYFRTTFAFFFPLIAYDLTVTHFPFFLFWSSAFLPLAPVTLTASWAFFLLYSFFSLSSPVTVILFFSLGFTILFAGCPIPETIDE